MKGFQYLEQRDTHDAITKEGVVSKKTPFATADNAGIYDTIAENFRYLKDAVDNISDTSEISSIRDEVKNMYEQMKTDGNFGVVAAKAQAQEALKQAKAAAESASKASVSEQNVQNNAVTANNLLDEVKRRLSETKSMLDRIKELAKAGEAKLQEAETSIKGSEQNVKSLGASTKAAEANVASMQSDVKSALSEVRASKEEITSVASDVQKNREYVSNTCEEVKVTAAKVKESETSASNSSENAKKWATAPDSPDGVVDMDSPSGKTASSRSWAIESKKKATDATKAMETIRGLHETVITARDVAVKAEQSARAIQSVVDVAMGAAQQALADIKAIRNTIISSITWKGIVDSYSDLPKNPEKGWIYCVKTADKEHKVSAGDYLIWNGAGWDNAGKFIDMTQFAKIGDNVQFGEINGYTTPEGTGEFVVSKGGKVSLGKEVKVGKINIFDSENGLNMSNADGSIVRLKNTKTDNASNADRASDSDRLGGKTLQEIGTIISDVQTTLTSSISKVKQDGDNAIKNAIDSIRGMSPDALNTLQKIANAINNDPNFATTITNALNTKVSKSGDTMTGTLNFALDKGSVIGKVANENSYWKLWGADSRPSVALDIYGNGNNAEKGYFIFRKFVNGNAVAGVTLIGEENDAYFPYAVNANRFYASNWFRARGDCGFYFEDHGGGWHMTDNEWIRAFNGKNIYTLGKMRCDAGFEGDLRGTADNANKLGGYTIEQVIAMAKR